MTSELKKTIKVMSSQGLHARPASAFVKIANKFTSEIIVVKDGERVNGKSMMGILTLAAEQGSEIEIVISGPDAECAMQELEAFLSNCSDTPKSSDKE